jgi:hypothetical protein
MRFDFDSLSEDKRYKLMLATVLPRPIAWVTSQDKDGLVNAALFPFSMRSVRSLPPWERRGRNRSTLPAFFHGYLGGTGTLHTIVGESAKRRLSIGIGGDAAALEEDNCSLTEAR